MIQPFVGDITVTSTTPKFTKNALVTLETTPGDPSTRATFRYIQASVALTRYFVYVIDQNGNATAGITQTNDDTAPLMLGAPQMSGGIASGSYGFVYVGGGTGRIRVSANCAINVPLYTTATAGELDDATASAKMVLGVKLTTANGGASADAPCFAVGLMTIES